LSFDYGVLAQPLFAAPIERRRAKIVRLDEDAEGNTSAAILRFDFEFVDGADRSPGLMMMRVPLFDNADVRPRKQRRMLIETAWAELESYLAGEGEANIFSGPELKPVRPSAGIGSNEDGIAGVEAEDRNVGDYCHEDNGLDPRSERDLQEELRRIEEEYEEYADGIVGSPRL